MSELPAHSRATVASVLFDIGAVRFGNFTLHSGRISPIYLDLRVLASYPEALRLVAKAYRQSLEQLNFDLLAATPLAGLPIGTAISLEMNLPLVYPRPVVKQYGTGKLIEGHWRKGQTAVIVDDLITSGDSLLQGIARLEEAGLRVVDAVVLIDREQGGRQTLSSQGYRLTSVMTLNQLLSDLEDQGSVSPGQRAKVVAALEGSV